MGMGPMTGRGAGYCAGYPTPGFMNPVGGRLGLGLGWGRGRAPWLYPYYYGLGRFPAMPYSGYRVPYYGYGYGIPYYSYPPRMWQTPMKSLGG